MTEAKRRPGEPANLEALAALAQREHRAGRLPEAAAACQEILAVRPDLHEVQNYLGILLAQQGKVDQAMGRFEQALILQPNYADAQNNAGAVLLGQGRLAEAAGRFAQAIALNPANADAHNNLGSVLLNQGRPVEAAAHYTQALALRPDAAEIHNNLGNALLGQGLPAEAAARFRQAVALRPNYPEAFNNLGNALVRLRDLTEAVTQFRQAVALRPNYFEAENNLSSALALLGRFDEAVACCERVLALLPNQAEAYNNFGSVLLKQGKLDEAAARYRQALSLKPDYAEPELGLAICHLTVGDYERGWPAYEARLRANGFLPPPGIPRWKGEALSGRTLLVVAEQGLGDMIQFLRYLRPLKELGARVILTPPAVLRPLLASFRDADELWLEGTAEQPLPVADFYLPLMSAPLALLGTSLAIPADVPYLWADPHLAEQWRQELSGIKGFKIGIAWQGSREYRSDRWRSIPLAEFAPLAALPGVQLVSLQKGFGTEQIATVDFSVLDLSARLDQAAGPFMDTAAVIRNLDLVVTADTAMAHLAGALGAPVWVAMRRWPDWRWQREREDSPWYPTLRLFRQSQFGQWSDVFERMAAAVEKRLSEKWGHH